MNRKPIVAGNWKMNLGLAEGIQHIAEIIQKLENQDDPQCEIVLIPSYLHLHSAVEMTTDFEGIQIGAQDISRYEKGAFTGDVSAAMVASTGASHVIIGHSERRAVYKENEDVLLEKLKHALDSDLNVIFCVGEELTHRYSNTEKDVVTQQLNDVIFKIPISKFKNVTIAYEPVWAIGTGETATPEQAQEMHEHIRNVIGVKFGRDIAESTRILYGGSCKPDNAAELFAQTDIDGGLIGGASLQADDFIKIIFSVTP